MAIKNDLYTHNQRIAVITDLYGYRYVQTQSLGAKTDVYIYIWNQSMGDTA